MLYCSMGGGGGGAGAGAGASGTTMTGYPADGGGSGAAATGGGGAGTGTGSYDAATDDAASCKSKCLAVLPDSTSFYLKNGNTCGCSATTWAAPVVLQPLRVVVDPEMPPLSQEGRVALSAWLAACYPGAHSQHPHAN